MDDTDYEVSQPRWRESARCLQVDDPDMFFPDRQDPAAEALALCRTCPVLTACRRHALELPERYGVWGGLTEVELEHLRKASGARRAARRPSAWIGLSRRRIGA